MYGVSNFIDFEALKRRCERAEQLVKQWRMVAFGMLIIAVICLACVASAVAAAEPVAPSRVTVECWRFDANGERELEWQATGRRAWVELRGKRQVLVVEQFERVLEREVDIGSACVVRASVGQEATQ